MQGKHTVSRGKYAVCGEVVFGLGFGRIRPYKEFVLRKELFKVTQCSPFPWFVYKMVVGSGLRVRDERIYKIRSGRVHKTGRR